MFKRFSDWPIGRKAGALTVVTSFLGCALLAGLQSVRMNEALNVTAEQGYAAVTQLLAANMGGAVRWGKSDRIELAYRDLTAKPDSTIDAIRVWNAEGKLLQRYEHESATHDFDTVLSTQPELSRIGEETIVHGEDYIVHLHPVVDGKQPVQVGTLGIVFTLAQQRAQVRQRANL